MRASTSQRILTQMTSTLRMSTVCVADLESFFKSGKASSERFDPTALMDLV